jgi:hypothetical protein
MRKDPGDLALAGFPGRVLGLRGPRISAILPWGASQQTISTLPSIVLTIRCSEIIIACLPMAYEFADSALTNVLTKGKRK